MSKAANTRNIMDRMAPGWSARRIGFGLLLVVALAILVMGRVENPLVLMVRGKVVDATAPVMHVLSRPVDALRDVADTVSSWIDVREENVQLREEVARLRHWQQLAIRYEQENADLRSLNQYRPLPRVNRVSGAVYRDETGSYVRSVLVRAGRRDGVEPGMAAVTGEGVAGRVDRVSERASQILLLSDFGSRVPVRVAGDNSRAILVGDNKDRPSLMFVSANARIEPGALVTTSGDGGMFPPGLMIGRVATDAGPGVESPRVQLFARPGRARQMSILLYRLPQLDDSDGEASDFSKW